jgi:hypothetical protein
LIGELTLIVPVLNSQVGWIIFKDGAAGSIGCASTTATCTELIHPTAFFTLTLYVPDVTPLNTPVVFK